MVQLFITNLSLQLALKSLRTRCFFWIQVVNTGKTIIFFFTCRSLRKPIDLVFFFKGMGPLTLQEHSTLEPQQTVNAPAPLEYYKVTSLLATLFSPMEPLV